MNSDGGTAQACHIYQIFKEAHLNKNYIMVYLIKIQDTITRKYVIIVAHSVWLKLASTKSSNTNQAVPRKTLVTNKW
jgi:hypothetical protein